MGRLRLSLSTSTSQANTVKAFSTAAKMYKSGRQMVMQWI